MLVSISIGSKSRAVINTLKVSADNFDFATYSSMGELIKSATLRHICFDRIVFSSEILDSNDPEEDLRALHEFITNYSSQTELVFIIKNSSEAEGNLDKLFCSMFNSPMYTPVIMKKANAQTLLEIVRDDITELKTRYYVLQDKEDKVITSASTGTDRPKEQSKEVVEQQKPEKKKGFFDRVFGSNSKKEALLKDMASNSKENVTDAGNIGEMVPESTPDNGNQINVSSVGEVEMSNTNSSSGNYQQENIFSGAKNGSVSVGTGNLDGGFSESMSEDEMLSIGEFGEKHSDTGFLDSDDEEELKRYAESKNESESSSEEGTDSEDEDFYGFTPDFSDSGVERIPDDIEIGTGRVENTVDCDTDKRTVEVEIPKRPVEQPKGNEHSGRKSNIDLIVSVKGSGATQSIVDEAVKLVEEDHIKVLIIDLDLQENGVLSYIDTERFYMQGSNDGISKMRVYEEDGVGVVSNGYGVPVSRRVLMNFITSRLVKKYDMIFIDCPTDSLKLFDYDMISMCNVLVMSGNDRSDLVATTLALTDRRVVDYKVERYIADNCLVEFTGGKYLVEDVTWLNDICLFANGNWLSRIDV